VDPIESQPDCAAGNSDALHFHDGDVVAHERALTGAALSRLGSLISTYGDGGSLEAARL